MVHGPGGPVYPVDQNCRCVEDLGSINSRQNCLTLSNTDKFLQLACFRKLKVVQSIKEMGDYMRKLGVHMIILEVRLGSKGQYVR